MKIKNKKALAPIITTILLILLSIAGIAVLAAAVIPFVKDRLEGTKCFDTINQFNIDTEHGYACYDGLGNVKITIHNGMSSIYGFRMAVYGDASSEIFDITSADGLPVQGTEKTYIKHLETITHPERAVLVPMLSEEKICEQKDETTLVECA